MKRVLIFFLLLMFSGQVYAQGDWKNHYSDSKIYHYKIIAEDCSEHITAIMYEGMAEGYQYQTGHSSRPPWTFSDTRECHYGVRNRISRMFITTDKTTDTDLVSSDFFNKPYIAYPNPLKILSDRDRLLLFLSRADLTFLGIESWEETIDIFTGWIEEKKFQKVVLFAPGALMYHSAEMIMNSPDMIEKFLPKVLGFRPNVNCGEEGPNIDRMNNSNIKYVNFGMKYVPEIEHYLFVYDIYKHWRYKNPDDNKIYRPVIVYPLEINDLYRLYVADTVIKLNKTLKNELPSDKMVTKYVSMYDQDDWLQKAIDEIIDSNWLDEEIKAVQPKLEAELKIIETMYQPTIGRHDKCCINDRTTDGSDVATVTSESGKKVVKEKYFLNHLDEILNICGSGCYLCIKKDESFLKAAQTQPDILELKQESLKRGPGTLIGALMNKINSLNIIKFFLTKCDPRRDKIELVQQRYETIIKEKFPELWDLNRSDYRECVRNVLFGISE